MKENDLITITDEEGVESTFVILFTYTNEKRNSQYVFFYDEENDEEVMYARYFEDGTLQYVEDEEEIAEIEEVFATFESDLEDEDEE